MKTFIRWTENTESALLCLLLSLLIGLSCLQISLRTFSGGGLLWADPVLRHLVVWCGFLGGAAATGKGKHIAIDLITNRLPKKSLPWLELVTSLFGTVTAAALSWAAWIFIQGEMEYGGVGPLGVPLWTWNMIYPLAFAIITGKYFIGFIVQIRTQYLSFSQKT